MTIDLTGFVQRKTKLILGTKEFTFTELTIADLAEFRAEMQTKRDAFNQERRHRLIEDAKKIGNIDSFELLKYADKPLTEDEVDDEMESISGIAYLAYLSLRYAHTGISREQVDKIVSLSAMADISKAMFPPLEDEKKTKAKNKTIKKPVL